MQLINQVQGPVDWNEVSQLFQIEVGHRNLYGFVREGKTLVEVDDENGRKLLEVNSNVTLRYLMCELWGPRDYQVVEHWTRKEDIADGSLLLTMLLGDMHRLELVDLTVRP